MGDGVTGGQMYENISILVFVCCCPYVVFAVSVCLFQCPKVLLVFACFGGGSLFFFCFRFFFLNFTGFLRFGCEGLGLD